MKTRACGVLLHPTSLPSAYGVGDLGPAARQFAESLAEAGALYWQTLPLGPTSPALGNSPYAGFTAFAGSRLLLSPEDMVDDGLLEAEDLGDPWTVRRNTLDYDGVAAHRDALLATAFDRVRHELERDPAFKAFREEAAPWLEDWALFATLKATYGGRAWKEWPDPYRFREAAAMDEWRDRAGRDILAEEFAQFLFHRQWSRLKRHCHHVGVRLFGDMPIYVAHDSADVWSRPELFKLDANRLPYVVAGVPPDYFSSTGQRWGNPVYDWTEHARQGYDWWMARMGHITERFDLVRVDHFRGFAGYWEIPAEEPTAVGGCWVEGPGEELFAALARRFPALPIVAEDLGLITADVRELKRAFALPGMYIVQFAFGAEWRKHILHIHERNAVAYTGTHDNNTFRGWYRVEATEAERSAFHRYLSFTPDEESVHLEGMRLVMASVAGTAITPMQDVLGLDESCRMNTPSTMGGNWEWRLLPEESGSKSFADFTALARFYDRAG